MLRAECNFLRKEKELAERMCEQGSLELENAIRVVHCMRSALQTLLLKGRKSCIIEEETADLILQSTLRLQIQILQERLEKLRKSSELREMELLKNCCNFENGIIAEEADIKSCKEVSCSIAKQLKSETQQLSQLQMILHHLEERAKELHKSRDAWQNRAFHAKEHESTLLSSMQEWRCKARSSQSKVSHLQSKISRLKNYQQNQNASASTLAGASSTCSSAITVLYDDKYAESSAGKDQSKKKNNASVISKDNIRIPNPVQKQKKSDRNGRIQRSEGLDRGFPLSDVSNSVISDDRFNRSQSLALNSNPRKL